MTTPRPGRPRVALLLAAYAIGVLGILASDGGGDGIDISNCEIEISAIAPQTNLLGDIWVGIRTRRDGNTVNGVLRLAVNGSTVTSHTFDDSSDANLVSALAVATDPLHAGDVYVGGDFDKRILRLNGDGTPDPGFTVGSGFDGRVNSIVPANDGSGEIYVGGDFSQYDGTPVGGLVRLTSTGARDSGFAAIVANVQSVALATDAPLPGFVYSGGRTVPTAARWASNGRLDTSFDPAIAEVFALAPAADASGDVYAGGNAATGVVRLNADGSNNSDFDGGDFDDRILDIVIAGDSTGDIYVAGRFASYAGNSANGIVRLADDGSRRASFVIGQGFTDASDSPLAVNSIAGAIDGSTDIYAGGGFSLYDGTQSKGIARLNDDGTLDEDFSLQLPVGKEFCSRGSISGIE